MSAFTRAENLISVSGVALAAGASVLVPVEDNFAAFPRGVRTTLTATDDRVYFVPFAVTKRCTIKTLQVEVTTGQVSTAARLGIYAADANLKPAALLKESSNQPATTGAALASGTIGLEVPIGVYFAALKIDGASVVVRGVNGDSAVIATGDAAADLDGAAAAGEAFWAVSSISGALTSSPTLNAGKEPIGPLFIVEFDAVEA